jgi:hypothetical protein
MLANLRAILTILVIALVTVDASRLLHVMGQEESSSSSSGDGLTRKELKQVQLLLTPFYGTVQDTLKAKGDYLLGLLKNVESTTALEATMTAFETQCNESLRRRVAVLKQNIMDIYKEEGPNVKSKAGADKVFKEQLTTNTLNQVVKEVREANKRERESREDASDRARKRRRG